MAVTTSYSFGFVESIDPVNITGDADATSLFNGGVAVSGDHAGHTDATIFEADGDVSGSALVLPGTASAITQLSNGNLVVLADTGTDMSFTVVDGTGSVVTGPTSIGEGGPDVLDPEVAGLAGGGFVVAIQDFFGGTDNDVDIRVYDNNGTLITNFPVDGTGANDQNPSVAGLADGGFAVAWHRNIGSENDLWYAVYNADGSVRKAPAVFDDFGTFNRNASVVALDNGGFAIAYEDTGWGGASGGDLDISLGTFDASGNNLTLTDISQNNFDDTVPSLTQLSNGMLAVGSVGSQFGDTDPTWTLVDQNTGATLGRSSTGFTFNNDTETSIAAMNNGQIGAFFTTSGDVTGQILQGQRFSTGDAANDAITGDDLQDFVSGGGGNDTVQGGLNADSLAGNAGDDTFQYNSGESLGDTIDGGADFDRILALENANIANATVFSIEEIEFGNTTAVDKAVNIDAGQVGAGLAANLLVDGNESGTVDTLRIVMGADTGLSLAAFTFQNWNSGGTENDRILVIGDADAEAITGSLFRDDVSGGDGNDTIIGGGGVDVLRGGLGNDLYTVNAAGEAIEAANQGTDTVRSNVTYALGANLERLTLIGGGAANGTGNTLDNILTGNGNGNALDGLGGDDTLTGGAGADRFTFTTALNAATNVDAITDFQVGVDKIRLDNAIFSGLPLGPLAASRFQLGAANDPGDRIIYQQATGRLFFDADGDPAGPGGGAAPILFATVDPGTVLSNTDFVVF